MTRDEVINQLAVGSQGLEYIDIAREEFAEICTKAFQDLHLPLSLMFATDNRKDEGVFKVHAVFALDAAHDHIIIRAQIPQDDLSYPSLTATIMAAHWYERLIGDMFGIIADGHPDWRRLVHHENIPENVYPLRKDFSWDTKLDHVQIPYPMHAVEGEGIYEIPVGPIHAGIIEPGHFRFNVRGERIITLEGKLFFKHKGVEKLLEGKTPLEAMPIIEQVSGDAAVSHSLAFVQAIELIGEATVPQRAVYIRTILNELERLMQHCFDVGNMAGMGTGLTFMAMQAFRIKERTQRLNEKLFGHRFLRGIIIPGGVTCDISNENKEYLLKELQEIKKDINEVIAIGYSSDGMMERFETTGVLSHDAAIAYGAAGLPARASGVDRDVRRDYPYAAYHAMNVHVASKSNGDVRARYDVRVEELAETFRIIEQAVKTMPQGEIASALTHKAGSALGLAESWRGEIIDWVCIDSEGKIERCVIRDPSFCNWALFGELGPGNIVPDFPLCNKSLNLSYSGNDL